MGGEGRGAGSQSLLAGGWGQREESHIYPLPHSLPMQTFSVLPVLPTQLRRCPWCWGLLVGRAVGCAGPEHTIWGHIFLNPELPRRHELAIWGQLPECLRQHEHATGAMSL